MSFYTSKLLLAYLGAMSMGIARLLKSYDGRPSSSYRWLRTLKSEGDTWFSPHSGSESEWTESLTSKILVAFFTIGMVGSSWSLLPFFVFYLFFFPFCAPFNVYSSANSYFLNGGLILFWNYFYFFNI